MLEQLALGFSVALTVENFSFLVLGVVAGTLIGVLPGLGPAGTIALVLPVAYGMDPTTLIILLGAVYYGAMYGGSLTAILLSIPGEAASVVTVLDGHKMAKQGRAGPALAIAAIGSFVAGTFSILCLMLFAEPVTKWALKFGPPEYFALLLFGLSSVAALAGKSVVKGLISMVLGLAVGTVGVDTVTGHARFTGGFVWLFDGVEFMVVAMGLFAVSEVMLAICQKEGGKPEQRIALDRVWISLADLKYSFWAIIRGSLLGFGLGVLPGAGTTISSFIAYNVEKKVARHPERYGTGDIRGVAAPEAANNGASGGSLVPLLTLGVPGSVSTAMMLAALLVSGVTPGPRLMEQHPEMFWGLVASMYLGNIMLLVINYPLIPLWVRILDIPAKYLLPVVIVVAVIGIYALKESPVDLALLPLFGALGFYLVGRGFPLAPMVLGLVLGPMFEKSLRQSLIVSDGDWSIFATHPISLSFIILSILAVVGPLISGPIKRRKAALAT